MRTRRTTTRVAWCLVLLATIPAFSGIALANEPEALMTCHVTLGARYIGINDSCWQHTPDIGGTLVEVTVQTPVDQPYNIIIRFRNAPGFDGPDLQHCRVQTSPTLCDASAATDHVVIWGHTGAELDIELHQT